MRWPSICVLGTAGLPSFGHGAYFGVGAYAFGLAQFNVVANLWLCLGAALLAAGLARACSWRSSSRIGAASTTPS